MRLNNLNRDMSKPFRSHRRLLGWSSGRVREDFPTFWRGFSFRETHLREHLGRADKIALITCLKNLSVSGAFLRNVHSRLRITIPTLVSCIRRGARIEKNILDRKFHSELKAWFFNRPYESLRLLLGFRNCLYFLEGGHEVFGHHPFCFLQARYVVGPRWVLQIGSKSVPNRFRIGSKSIQNWNCTVFHCISTEFLLNFYWICTEIAPNWFHCTSTTWTEFLLRSKAPVTESAPVRNQQAPATWHGGCGRRAHSVASTTFWR